eukprot:2971164-Pyramimonas_sp.AAC.1
MFATVFTSESFREHTTVKGNSSGQYPRSSSKCVVIAYMFVQPEKAPHTSDYTYCSPHLF